MSPSEDEGDGEQQQDGSNEGGGDVSPMEDEGDGEQQQQKKSWGITRNGPPCRALIVKEGGAYKISTARSLEAFTQLYECRNKQLNYLHMSLDSYLPKAQQIRAQKDLENAWWQTDLGQIVWQECQKQWGQSKWGSGYKSKMKRNAASYYRRSQYEDYGGREWCFLLIALGRIDDTLVTCVNTVIERRRQEDLHPRPQPTKKHDTKGIHHQLSVQKRARLEAQQARAYAEKHPGNQRLQADAARATERANWISIERGHSFKDHTGKRVEGRHKTMVEEVLADYCRQKGIEYV